MIQSGKSMLWVHRVAVCFIAAVAAVELFRVIALQIATFHPMPWADEWDTLFLFGLAEKSPGTGLGYLFFPHNEHRIAIPRIITFLDLVTARGTGVINLATNVIVPALTTAVFWFAVRRRLKMPLLLIGCLACVLFSGGQMSNFLWGFQTQVWLLYLFALLAFYFTGKAIESGRRTPYLAACIFAIGACLSQSGGLLVFPPIIVLGAWHWRRTGRPMPLAIAIVAGLTATFYLWGPGWSPSSSGAFVSVRDQTLFALSFLGSPLAAIAPRLVIPAGVVASGLSTLLIIRYARLATPRLDETVAVAICLFTLAIAAAAAITRISWGIAAASESRFVTPALFLWTGLLLGLWPLWRGRLAALCTVAIAAYAPLSHLWLPYNYFPLRDLKANGEIAYLAGVNDAARLAHFGVSERLWAARPFVMRHGLAPFSSAVSQSVGRKLSDVYERTDGCRGHLDSVEPISGNVGYVLHGWALSDRGRAPAAVLLVQSGIVTGIGRFIEDRPDVLASDNGAVELRVGFVGVVRDLNSPVKAYAVARGAACPLVGELQKKMP